MPRPFSEMTRRVLAAGAIALAASGCRRQAQITSFMDVPFGAPMKQLVATLGAPASATPWPGGATSVTFPQRNVLDEPAAPNFVVVGDRVIQGGYTVYVVSFPARCNEAYLRYVDAVKARFPKLAPAAEHTGPSVDDPGFCQAAMDGRASASTEWNDPVNGARVLVSIERGEAFVRVVYQSQRSREWSRAMNDSMLKKDF